MTSTATQTGLGAPVAAMATAIMATAIPAIPSALNSLPSATQSPLRVF